METQFPGASDRERFHEGLRQIGGRARIRPDRGHGGAAPTRRLLADVEDVRRFPVRLAAFTEQAAATSRALKRFLFSQVYASPRLGADRSRSMAMIAELFEFFLDNPERLPQAYAEQAAGEPVHRVVCDYIAGMTDGFFRRTYEQMTGQPASLPQS